MKTVKFQTKDKRQFASALRKNVSDYFRDNQVSAKGNSSMITKAVVMLAIYLVPFIFLLTIPMVGWLIFPLTIMMGIGMAGIGMSVMHDAVHGSFSRFSWLNKFLSNTMYLLGGNVATWKVQHNMLHHTYTNIEGMDEDIKSKLIFRFSKHSPRLKIHRLQHIYAFAFYSLMTLSKLVRDFFSLHEYNKKGYLASQKINARKEMTHMIISKTIYLFVTIGLPLLVTGDRKST